MGLIRCLDTPGEVAIKTKEEERPGTIIQYHDVLTDTGSRRDMTEYLGTADRPSKLDRRHRIDMDTPGHLRAWLPEVTSVTHIATKKNGEQWRCECHPHDTSVAIT